MKIDLEVEERMLEEIPQGRLVYSVEPWKALAVLKALRCLRGALEELQLGHVHGLENPDYRPLGDTYGWCSICGQKVGLGEDTARDALAEADRFLTVSDPTPQDQPNPSVKID